MIVSLALSGGGWSSQGLAGLTPLSSSASFPSWPLSSMVAAPSLRTKTVAGRHVSSQPRRHGIITTPFLCKSKSQGQLDASEGTQSQCLEGGGIQEWRSCGQSSLRGIYQKDGKR